MEGKEAEQLVEESSKNEPLKKKAPEEEGSNGVRDGRKKQRQKVSYTCQICRRSSSTKNDLKRHQLVHTGEKPFSCKTCQKKFAHKADMEKHARIHTGERPYACECGKDFSDVSHLRRHKLTHTKEQPHLCMHCGKLFSIRSNLTRHIRTHTGEKPYVCKCGKGFAQSNDLHAHQLSHSRKAIRMCMPPKPIM